MPNELTVKNWSSLHCGEISEDAIRHIFQPSCNYRISCRQYPAGTSIAGASMAGICFLLSGECNLRFTDQVHLTTGTFVEFPSGDFELTVIGNQQVTLVKVWPLPENFRLE